MTQIQIAPTADATVYQDQPNLNDGSGTLLRVHNETSHQRHAYITFLVDVPDGVTITEAQVYLYLPDAYTVTNAPHATIVNDDWEEASIKWSNRPALGCGALGGSAQMDFGNAGTYGPGWLHFYPGNCGGGLPVDGNYYTWCISGGGQGDTMEFESKEGTHPPYMLVTYTP